MNERILKILYFIRDIITIIILLFVIFLVIIKYTINLNADKKINEFNKWWSRKVNEWYLYLNYDNKKGILHTNYELNKGLYKDLQNELNVKQV
tara:strand:- start:3 stop:281 length:279 start_codon:yes stop_codon:yes gene_type:complete